MYESVVKNCKTEKYKKKNTVKKKKKKNEDGCEYHHNNRLDSFLSEKFTKKNSSKLSFVNKRKPIFDYLKNKISKFLSYRGR